jgi:hypothetical protein
VWFTKQFVYFFSPLLLSIVDIYTILKGETAAMADSTEFEKTALQMRPLKIEDEKSLRRFREIAEYFLKNTCEGKILYKSGVKNNLQWRSICYASQNFRAYYALELFGLRSELACQAFKTAVEKDIFNKELFKDITKVASLGCGPGAEMWGFKNFCEEILPYSSNSSSSNGRKRPPRFTGYDSELGWMPFVESLDFEFVNKEIDVDVLRSMLPMDVIIMSYFAKSARVNIDSPEINCFWDELEKKANVILVVEMVDERLYKLLQDRGYSAFTIYDKMGNEAQVHCLHKTDYAVLRRTARMY